MKRHESREEANLSLSGSNINYSRNSKKSIFQNLTKLRSLVKTDV